MKVEASRPHRKKKIESIGNCDSGHGRLKNLGSVTQGQYETLIENMPCAVYSIQADQAAPTTFMFDKWKDLTGYSPGDLCRNPELLAQCIHPDDRQRTVETYAGVFRGESSYDLEYRTIHRDTGQVRHVRDQRFLIKDSRDAAIRVDGILTDITEHMKGREELERTRTRLKASIESPKSMIILAVDTEYKYAFFSKTYEQAIKDIYGVRIAVGKNLLDCITNDDDRAKARTNIDRALGGESFAAIQEHGDICKVYYETVYSPITEASGETIGVTMFAKDITERRRAEEALTASRAFAESVIETANAVVVVLDRSGSIATFNRYAEELTGYSRSEVMGKNWFDLFIAEDEKDAVSEVHATVLEDGAATSTFINSIITKSGRKKLIHWSNRSFAGGGPDVVGTLSIGVDVTEQKRAENALRENARLHQILLDSMPCVALLMRPHTREIVAANKAALKVGAVPGTTCYQTWAQSDAPCPWCLAPELWATGQAQHCEPDGDDCVWDAHWIPVSDDLFMHYAFDITERKRAEERARQRQAELIHVSRLSTIGQMASELAHELNQPLCATLTHLEVSLGMIKSDAPDTDNIIRKLEKAVKQTDRAGKIVSRVKSFAMKGQGKRSTVLVNDVVREAVDFMGTDIRHNHVTTKLDLCEELQPVFADPIQIEQVVLNFIQNAIEAMEETPKESRELTIVTRTSADSIEVVVKDTGIGIDKKDAEHIFESFTTTKSEGLGVGLSISQSIVESHGGQIYFRENPDRGVTFCFTLPLKTKKV